MQTAEAVIYYCEKLVVFAKVQAYHPKYTYRLDGQVCFEVGAVEPIFIHLELATFSLSIKWSITPNFKFLFNLG